MTRFKEVYGIVYIIGLLWVSLQELETFDKDSDRLLQCLQDYFCFQYNEAVKSILPPASER